MDRWPLHGVVGKVTLFECHIGNNLANIHMESWNFGNNIKVIFA